jgi:FRG domain
LKRLEDQRTKSIRQIDDTRDKKRRLDLVPTGEREAFLEYGARSGKDFTNSWQQLAEMQHHGLPTRLLDWTESLASAMYFALRSYREGVCGVNFRRQDTVPQRTSHLQPCSNCSTNGTNCQRHRCGSSIRSKRHGRATIKTESEFGISRLTSDLIIITTSSRTGNGISNRLCRCTRHGGFLGSQRSKERSLCGVTILARSILYMGRRW